MDQSAVAEHPESAVTVFASSLSSLLSPSQYSSFQTERSESGQDSPWGSSPLTDSASPRLLEQTEGVDASCVYRQFSDPRTLCYNLSEDQITSHTHIHIHGQGQSCERGRCEAGRYFLGAPPPGRETWWDTARSVIPLSKSSLENYEDYDGSVPHITAAHSHHGEAFSVMELWLFKSAQL